jgi:hypothetical protein
MSEQINNLRGFTQTINSASDDGPWLEGNIKGASPSTRGKNPLKRAIDPSARKFEVNEEVGVSSRLLMVS